MRAIAFGLELQEYESDSEYLEELLYEYIKNAMKQAIDKPGMSVFKESVVYNTILIQPEDDEQDLEFSDRLDDNNRDYYEDDDGYHVYFNPPLVIFSFEIVLDPDVDEEGEFTGLWGYDYLVGSSNITSDALDEKLVDTLIALVMKSYVAADSKISYRDEFEDTLGI